MAWPVKELLDIRGKSSLVSFKMWRKVQWPQGRRGQHQRQLILQQNTVVLLKTMTPAASFSFSIIATTINFQYCWPLLLENGQHHLLFLRQRKQSSATSSATAAHIIIITQSHRTVEKSVAPRPSIIINFFIGKINTSMKKQPKRYFFPPKRKAKWKVNHNQKRENDMQIIDEILGIWKKEDLQGRFLWEINKIRLSTDLKIHSFYSWIKPLIIANIWILLLS